MQYKSHTLIRLKAADNSIARHYYCQAAWRMAREPVLESTASNLTFKPDN